MNHDIPTAALPAAHLREAFDEALTAAYEAADQERLLLASEILDAARLLSTATYHADLDEGGTIMRSAALDQMEADLDAR